MSSNTQSENSNSNSNNKKTSSNSVRFEGIDSLLSETAVPTEVSLLMNQEPDDKTLPAAQDGNESFADIPPPPAPIAHRSSSSVALRGNLTREQRNRDPYFYYDVIQVLGKGSMGSVTLVKKKDAVVGGSARKELQDHFRTERKLNACFQLPVVGGWFQFCLKDKFQFKEPALTSSTRSSGSYTSAGSGSGSGSNKTSQRKNTNGTGPTTPNNSLRMSSRSGSTTSPRPIHNIMYAMKSIHLERVTDEVFIKELKNEIDILRTLDHPHIVRAIETYEYKNQIFIVMEQCTGGDLYTRDPYTEADAARITSSILSALAYMHSRNITHRDLKYENVLFVNKSPKSEVKLIDFGLSTLHNQGELTEGVGTIYTMAPEVLKGKYSKQADLWSVGVVAYMLLASSMPFYGRDRRKIIEKILTCDYKFGGRRWKKNSEQSKEFVQDLLVMEPDERPTAEEALAHSWLSRRTFATVRNPLAEELEAVRYAMVRYAGYPMLKKVALMVIAHKSTVDEIGMLRKIFYKYDTAGNGQLSYQEFRAAVADARFTDQECSRIFKALDLDGAGSIRYTEFLASAIESQGVIDEHRLAEAFDQLDCDDSGYITEENLKAILGEEFPNEEIKAIINECDLTRDKRISYNEFLAMWDSLDDDAGQVGVESNGSSMDVLDEQSKAYLQSKAESVAAYKELMAQKLVSERSLPSVPVTTLSAESSGYDFACV